MDNKIEIITNPLTGYSIGNTKEMSVLDLYLMNYDLFMSICDDKSGTIRFSDEIIRFFKKCGKPSEKKNYKDNYIKYRRMWEVYEDRRKRKTIRETEKKFIARKIGRDLLKATLENTIIWEEVLNSHSADNINEKYKCNYEEWFFYFNVTGFKNAEKQWKVIYELNWENIYGDTDVCEKIHNLELYKAIQRHVVHKERIVDNPYVRRKKENEEIREIDVSYGNFVVRTNLFRCFYKEHLLEEIIGIMKIVTPQGETILERIPCAYCSECNCFYMLTSEFNRISSKGVLLCQLIDKEDYYKAGIPNKFNGASESLLMRNGYNVKAYVGLTDIQRQVILKNIIDNKILSPHRIVSYIDTFIAQKKNLVQYKEAVTKWKKDRGFVLSYADDRKRAVQIKSIRWE